MSTNLGTIITRRSSPRGLDAGRRLSGVNALRLGGLRWPSLGGESRRRLSSRERALETSLWREPSGSRRRGELS